MSAVCWCVLMRGLGLADSGPAHAQSIYRCGSSYSHDAECKQGTATSVPLQGATTPASKAQTGLAQQLQNEAGRLENIRQRETLAIERQQGKALEPHTVKKSPTASQDPAQKTSNDLPSQHKKKKRKKSTTTSPYFTAKGAADGKKP